MTKILNRGDVSDWLGGLRSARRAAARRRAAWSGAAAGRRAAARRRRRRPRPTPPSSSAPETSTSHRRLPPSRNPPARPSTYTTTASTENDAREWLWFVNSWYTSLDRAVDPPSTRNISSPERRYGPTWYSCRIAFACYSHSFRWKRGTQPECLLSYDYGTNDASPRSTLHRGCQPWKITMHVLNGLTNKIYMSFETRR